MAGLSLLLLATVLKPPETVVSYTNVDVELPGRVIRCPERAADQLIRLITSGPTTVIDGVVEEQPDAIVLIGDTRYNWTPQGLTLVRNDHTLEWPNPYPGVLEVGMEGNTDIEWTLAVEDALSKIWSK